MSLAGGDDPLPADLELPSLDAPLGDLDFPLRATVPPGSDAPIPLAGRRAFAIGTAGGITEIGAHPLRLATSLHLPDARADAVVVTPLGLQRRLRVGEVPVVERVAVHREAPACVLEWHAPEAAVELTLEWTCDVGAAGGNGGGAEPLPWQRVDRGLVAGGEKGRAVFAFDAAPATLDVERLSEVAGSGAAGLRVRARLRLAAGGYARLAVIGGTDQRSVRRGLAAVARAGMTRARRGHAERLLADRLTLDSADGAAGDALEWAKVGLDAAHADVPGVGRSLLAGYAPGQRHHATRAAVLGAWAALATGDAAPARDVLTLLGTHQRDSGEVPGACATGETRYGDPGATPAYLLLAGQVARWTGDLRAIRSAWSGLWKAVEFCRGVALRGPALELWATALSPFADAAEAIGETNAAAMLREAAELEFPVAAHQPVDPSDTAAAAGVVLRLVHGLLGAEPDATRGRLVLRPRPGGDAFTARGLMVGTAAVTLDYSREQNRHTFRVVQARGAAPLNVVLEPLLPGRRLVGARVDGGGAELDARPAGDRMVVPVQLVLDHAREVVVEVER